MLPLLLSYIQIFSRALCCQTPLVSVLPVGWKTKFRTVVECCSGLWCDVDSQADTSVSEACCVHLQGWKWAIIFFKLEHMICNFIHKTVYIISETCQNYWFQNWQVIVSLRPYTSCLLQRKVNSGIIHYLHCFAHLSIAHISNNME